MLTLIEGPAGSGKSQLARDLLAAGHIDLLADVTNIFAAITGATRGPDGKYPVRLDSDPGVAASLYVQAVIARYALRNSLRVAVTTSRRNQVDRWKAIADEEAAAFAVRTVDPGIEIIRQRLSEGGRLETACEVAMAKWYGLA